MSRPRPGRLNTVSTITAPASRLPNCRPKIVITGISAFFSACRTTTPPRGPPTAPPHRHAPQRELRGAPDVLADLGRHGPPAPDGGAQIPAERVGDEAAVLFQDRLVQVELRPHLRDLLRRRDELGEHD